MARRSRRRAVSPDGAAVASADHAKRRVERRSGRHQRRGGGLAFSRLLYWGFVLGLWGVIAAAGAFAFVLATLPPIQSLEVPKRPPTVEIVGMDGRPLVSRGEMSGIDVPLKDLPPYMTRAFESIGGRSFYQSRRMHQFVLCCYYL